MARTFATILIILAGAALVFVIFQVSGQSSPTAATQPESTTAPAVATSATQPVAPTAASATTQPIAQVAAASTQPAATAPVALTPWPTADAARSYHALGFEEARVATLGSLEHDSNYKIQAELSAWGASVLKVALTDYKVSVAKPDHYVVQEAQTNPDVIGRDAYIYPFAARSISIDGHLVDLGSVKWQLIEPSEPLSYRTSRTPLANPPAKVYSRAVYALTIADPNNEPVVEIRRTYQLDSGDYQLVCRQEVRNLTNASHSIVYDQLGQGDTPGDDSAYLGDHRLVAIGYFNLSYNPTKSIIYPDDHLFFSNDQFRTRLKVLDGLPSGTPLWPPAGKTDVTQIVWTAGLNRYFAAAVYRPVEPKVAGPNHGLLVQPMDVVFPAVNAVIVGPTKDLNGNDGRKAWFTFTSGLVTLAAKQTANFDLVLFAGPRDPVLFTKAPFDALSFDKLIIYSLGGMCSFCTFQWLAHILLGFLTILHNYIFFDWGVAIIVLVLVVRLVLHPLTKRSQISMTRASKQMAALQPELAKLQKKYADDQNRLNTETMALYRERGVNPMGAAGGCLPMLLQMPIWIALYATLYYAIELRHQPAFFGMFQALSGGHWPFLADLSSPDRFIPIFDQPHLITLIFIKFDYSSINLIPILMGVVFYFQQKINMPPPANEQMAQQQSMMKYMVFVMPLLMYSVPSGLTLYISASTAAGILDGYIVKQHIKKEEAAGTLFKKKSNGFMDRVFKALEEKQKDIERLGDNEDVKKRK